MGSSQQYFEQTSAFVEIQKCAIPFAPLLHLSHEFCPTVTFVPRNCECRSELRAMLAIPINTRIPSDSRNSERHSQFRATPAIIARNSERHSLGMRAMLAIPSNTRNFEQHSNSEQLSQFRETFARNCE